jgi:hypothetical protein
VPEQGGPVNSTGLPSVPPSPPRVEWARDQSDPAWVTATLEDGASLISASWASDDQLPERRDLDVSDTQSTEVWLPDHDFDDHEAEAIQWLQVIAAQLARIGDLLQAGVAKRR